MSSLAGIVRALGGELSAGGLRATVPGPGHSADDRSVSLLLSSNRVIVHSFAGDDWSAVLADLQSRGLIDAEGRPVVDACSASVARDDALSRAERTRAALRLWDAASPICATLSAAHCRRRGVIGPPWPDDLRHHSAIPAAVYRAEGLHRPGLLALIRDAGGVPCGVELTYLAVNGERARLRTPRKTVGQRPASAAVRLAPAEGRLLVAEGVFTTLSASAVFGRPGWALLAAQNLARWTAPADVRDVLIAADRGRVGEAAAARLAWRLRGRGLRAEVRLPPQGFEDWNAADVLGRPEGKEGRGRASGADGQSGRQLGTST